MGKRFSLLFVFSSFASFFYGQTIVRGPYIQMLSEDRAVVRYRTSSPVPTEVQAGTTLGVYTETFNSAATTTEHEAVFTGLNADTPYYYSIFENANVLLGPDASRYFQTAPLSGTQEPVRAWILGDCGTGNASARAVRDAYYTYLGNRHNDLVLMLGDNAYNNGTDAEYQTAVFQNMYEDILAQSPLFPTPGNHEFYNGYTSSTSENGPYYDIFSLPTNAELGGLASGTEAYYSFDYANIHFISMDSHDSDRSPGGPMLTWLQNDLALTQQEWIVVYFHHPPYSKGSHDSDDPLDSGGRLKDMRENALPILESYGVDLVLSGHSHSYERSFLLEGHYDYSSTLTPAMILDSGDGRENGDGAYEKDYINSNSTEGTVYITTGNAGKISGGALNHPVMYASFNTLGSCILEVDGDLLNLKFLNSGGVIADSFSIEKEIYVGYHPTVSVSNPLDGAFIPLPTNINLSSTIADQDGNVLSVEYFVDGLSVGTSSVTPFDLSWTIPASGTFNIYAIATDDDGNSTTSATNTFNVGSSTASFTVAIANVNDDAEENTTGVVKLNSTDLELINEATTTDQIVGLRFQNLNLPPGARVDSAYIQFTVDETVNDNPIDLTIRGEAHFNSSAFTNVVGNLSGRSFTTAQVNWTPSNWNSVGTAGPDQRTSDIGPVLQEIIDLPGWQLNQAASFFIAGWGRRIAESSDGTAAPELSVYYTILPTPSNTPPAVLLTGIRDNTTQLDFDPINFVATTADSTDYVARVEFYLNGSLLVNDNTYPFTHSITPATNGSYQLIAIAVDQGGLSRADTLDYTIDNTVIPLSQTFSIAASAADAEEDKNGNVLLNGTQLEIVRNANYTTGNQLVGLHYSNLGIPSGSVIYEAYLQFTSIVDDGNYHMIDLEISGEASDDATLFSTSNQDLSSRPRTNAKVPWLPPIWTTVTQTQAAQKSPDLSGIIQEIVDRSAWQENNGLAFLIEGQGGRAAYAYEANPSLAAQLVVSYVLPVQVSRGPYLQMGSDTSVVVRLRTESARQLKLIYGNSVSNLNQSLTEGSSSTEHEIFVGGLSPNTTYYYAFVEGTDTFLTASPDQYWRSAPAAGTQQVLKAWILGDPGMANANARAVRDAYYTRMGSQHTDLMIMLGDNAYNNGTDLQYQTAVFENMYEELLKRTILYPTPGNHEFYNAGTDSPTESGPYYDIFSLPRNAEAGGLASGTEAYYSYDYGNVHFISMDSHDSDRSIAGGMLTWLTNDLAATDQEWIVVYFHHPPYTKGSHDSDNIGDSGGRMRDMRENALPILEDYGVDLVLSGHSHSYERSFLLNGHYDVSSTLTPAMILDGGNGQALGDGAYEKNYINAASDSGTVYITAGSSGKISGGALNHPAMYASLNTLGSCLLEVDGDQLSLKFLASTGSVADSFMIQKTLYDGFPPVVSISAPLDGSSFAGPQTVNLVADATDSDGTISSVEFFVNGASVGTVNTAPWQFPYAANAIGNYDVYAIATDDKVNSAYSDTIQFSITAIPIPPTVSISAPLDGTIYPAPQTITLSANAADSDGTVNSVEFFVNGASVGTVNVAPWQIPYVIPASGTYNVYAIATDDDANSTTSATIQFTAKIPPTVSISAPLDATIYPAPQTITLSANASDADGTVNAVEFFVNGASVGTVNAAPWQIPYVIPASGTYNVYAIATDDDLNSTTSATIQFTAKIPPTVSISAPLDGTIYPAPQTITLSANAADVDGTVNAVEFFVNGASVGTVNAAPWQIPYVIPAPGTYDVYAIATDDDANSTTSATIQFTAKIPPTVSISAPLDATIYPAPQTITLLANAADADGTVNAVEFFVNGASVGTVNAAPWQIPYVIPAPGTYDVYAIATDDDANSTTSATIQFTAKIPPTVSISAPLDGTIYPAPQTITLEATAADADGIVNSVEFFVNGASIGTVNAAPWQLSYVIPANGVYNVYAIATDDDANSTTSASIQFTVNVPLIPPTVSISAPLDGTIYPAPQTITLSANAADVDGTVNAVEFYVNGASVGTVNAAPWQLSYVIPASGIYNVYAIATDDDANSTTSATIQFTAKIPPTVSISAPLDGTIYPAPQTITLSANAADADGTVNAVEFFVNGVSVGTVNAAPWQLSYVIPASGIYNVYAIATDDDLNSTTSATIQFTAKIPPTVSISAPLDGTIYPTPQTITLSANAADADGTVNAVEFFVNGASVGMVNAAPWQLSYVIPASGTYNVYAIASDDDANSTTSATIQFTAKIPPTVSISAPLDATIYPAPQTITLSANAADADGTVNAVEFFVNGASVGTVNAAPWQLSYVIPASGTYNVYAIATDDDLNSTTSATIQFTAKIPPTVSISVPLDGTIYLAPQTITLSANAADADGTINAVEFFVNGASVGTVNAAPWQLSYVIPASGIYNVYAIATDDDANSTTSATIQFTAKIPPTVSISAPLDGTIYPLPQTITLSANAADADGTVNAVEFFVNGASVGTVNAAPWQIPYVIPAPGTYDVYAIATDDDANSTTSATIQFSVPFTNPVVSIIAPLDGTIFPNPQVVNIIANATDPNGTISNVRFYANGISIGTVFFSPWQINLNAPAGIYNVHAIATDNQLNSTTSDTIQFIVNSTQINLVEIQIDQDDDDGVEKKDGKVELDKDWIEMAEKGGQDFVMAAYRFRNIPLGPEVGIDSAFIVFQSRGSDDRDPISLLIYGEDNINAAGFTNTNGDLSDRPRTNALIPWTPNAWPVADVDHKSADLAPLVQEMIDLHGWANGNAMAFFIAGEGKRMAYAHDKNQTRAAKLKIYYRNLPPTANTAPEIEFANQDSSILRIDFASISLLATVSDSTGGISQVAFAINGSPLSIDATYPFEASYTPTSNGIYEIIATVTDDGGLTAMDTLLIEVDNTILMQTVSLQISQNEGDGEEAPAGFMELNDNSIQLVKEKNAGEQWVAFNFGAGGIPADADILEAYIQFTSKEHNQNYHPIDINIHGEYDASSSLLQNVNFDISNRVQTQTSINWQPLIWIVNDTEGERQRTPDLSKIVAEMASHAAWSSSSPLTFIFSGMGGRPLHSFESDPAKAAQLVLKYKLAPPLTRGPYLQSGSDTSIVLRFQTKTTATVEIHYGNTLSNLTQSITSASPSKEHTFQINNLTPDTRYFYEIREGGQNLLAAANDHYWQTAPVAGVIDTVRAWVLGDAGTSNTDARSVRNSYENLMGNKHTDMILMLGDNAYMDGTEDDYQTAVFENMYEDLLARTVLWTSPGEREFENGYTDSNTESGPYFDIFNLPRNAEAGGVASGTEAYYSYDYSNVHFVSLDVFGSDVSPAGSMLSWLQTDLVATTQDWIVVSFHHSPYSKGAFDSDTTAQMIAVRENILPILETNGVDLVLSAHSQSYERSFLSEGHYQASHTMTDAMILDERSGNPSVDGPYAKSPTNGQGTVYVVSGSAGKTEAGDFDHPIMYKGEATLGSSILEVFDRTLDFRFIDAAGNVVDQFQIVKGEAPQVELSTPGNAMAIPAPQNVTLSANATDNDGNVVSVAFAVNGTIENTDNAAPWTHNWTPSVDGIYEIVAIATDDDGIISYSAPVTVFVGTTFNVCIPISSGGNDVEENAAGLMDLRNEALALIDKNGSQQIGLRFEQPNIYPGASITNAFIQFTADTIQTASTLLFFEVENAFPSTAFGNQANDVSSRSYQTGIVSWNVPAWSNIGDATADQQTPDLTSQIDQYINNPTYQFNQPITYRVSGSGLRTARSYDQKSGDQAVLCVSFELPAFCFPINDVAAIKLWHKADVGVYEDNGVDDAETGDGIARWQNFASQGADAQQSIMGKRPVYTEPTPTGIFNGSGGMAFGSNRSLQLPDNWSENNYQVIVVQRSANAASKQAILASASSPNTPYIQIYKEGQNYFYSMGTDAQNETILIGVDESNASEYHIIDVKNINNELEATLDATPYYSQSIAIDPLSTGILQQITLGEDPNDDIADFQGEIAEVFVFNRSLTGVEYGQVMTYLSVKYGISIPFTAHNYYSYGTHDDRLFGIGQNLDDRCLQKTNSRSVMPDNRVRFYNPSDLDEGEFLISGDDDASTAIPSIQVPNSFQIRLARTYRVRETGDIGIISLDFDMAGLGLDLSQAGRYFLLIDDDGDFSDAQIANTSLASLSGSVLSFSGIDFSNGDYYTIGYRESLQLSPKVMLTGPYNAPAGLMNDALRSNNLIPEVEPYEAMSTFTHVGFGGGETVDPSVFIPSGNDAIVDWVFVELRDAADSTVVLATRSALLQRDGDVVGLDGNSPVSFPGMSSDDYFVAIRHRNHLPVMTANAVSLSGIAATVDFTDPSTQTYGDNAQKQIAATVMGLWAGDVNQDKTVVFQGFGNDPQRIFLAVLTAPGNSSFARNYIVSGYSLTDVNLDGQTIFQGGGTDVSVIFINILTYPDNTGFNRNYVVSGRLPE